MVLNYTENGEILGFAQKVDGRTSDYWPRFTPDEIVYFRQYWIGSQVYSHAPFQSIGRSYATKVYANDYLQSIFRNLPPKLIYFLKNANDKQRQLFTENLIRAKTNPNMDIIAQGEAFDTKLMEVSFDGGLVKVLEYLRKEILMITRVPPHWVGIMDGANRGIGENVVIPYETKIKKVQQKIASQINKELLPRLGFSNIEFKWNAISLLDEKEVIANMGQLSAMRFDSDTIMDYGRERGLNISEEAEIEEVQIPMGGGNGPQIQNDSAPSRQRKGKSDTMNNNLDSKGVSSDGKEKLETKKVAV